MAKIFVRRAHYPKERSKMRKLLVGTNPLLYRVCDPVTEADDLSYIDDLIQVCQRSRNGVGLAACQIGVLKRTIYIFPDRKHGEVLVNPEITVRHYEESGLEGCLSYPGIEVTVKRSKIIHVRFNPVRIHKGRYVLMDRDTEIYQDFAARIVQHEIDHLNGECKVRDELGSMFRNSGRRKLV